jgi:hypothetical protein
MKDNFSLEDIENEIQEIQSPISESEISEPKKERKKYEKKKKIDGEKEGEAVITILNFFSDKILKNKLSESDAEFHRETAKQIAEQYDIAITEYVLFIRIIVSIGMILIHYWLSTIAIFRKKHKEVLPDNTEQTIENENK